MINSIRLSELGAFIRSRRDNLSPEEIGITHVTGRRSRRTKGLRREEVAALAGISVDWYTLIEQGHAKPSVQVLDQLADTLRFTPEERIHLYHLAGLVWPRALLPTAEQVPPALLRVLDYLHPCPAYVLGRCWDLLRWNQAAAVVFATLLQVADAERNLLYQVFTNPEVQRQMLIWEETAHQMTRQFRRDYGQHVGDPAFVRLIDELEHASSQFTDWWQTQAIEAPTAIRQELAHPHLGRLLLEQTTYATLDAAGLRLVLQVPLNAATSRTLQQIQEA